MKLNLYQVDAFTSTIFTGNPAAVIPLDAWIDDETMQALAMENNLAETVFFVPSQIPDVDFEIRWFTPEVEINLCGHATLASAFTLFEILGFTKPTIVFHSNSGLLKVTKKNDLYEMDFPSWNPERVNHYPNNLDIMLGISDIVGVFKNRDLLIEVETEEEVLNANPDFNALKKTGEMIILTAKGDSVDFVSRFFAPAAGINEDPVTGSAHSQLIPYWSKKLGKKEMFAKQLSKRGGEIWCEQLNSERVKIGGNCVLFMRGEFEI